MSEPFHARLRRLRREGGEPCAAPPPSPAESAAPDAAAAAPADPPAQPCENRAAAAPAQLAARGMPAWLRARLDRRGAPPLGGRAAEDPGAARSSEGEPWPPVLDPPAELEEVRRAEGVFALRKGVLCADHRHGGWCLDEVGAVERSAFELTTGDARLAGLDPRRAVYFDTETTGLSGGAGTTVFLVGLGWFEAQRFVLWQGFLRSPAEERALLAAVAERVGEASALVSFFGKSFDRHRLEDKMRLHRVPPPFEGLAHLDLYHPLRRLYGASFPDARLRTMEASLCGFERVGDLPGSRAPEAWFDYLAGRPHRLEGVFRHNAEDVLSLVTLAAHLGRVTSELRADGTTLPGCTSSRAGALARLCLARRDRDGARRWLERHLSRSATLNLASDPSARESRYLLAEVQRRAGEDEAAELLHAELAGDPRDLWSVRALVALSKLAEHRRRDRAAALAHASAARALLDRICVGPERAPLARDLEGRLARLS